MTIYDYSDLLKMIANINTDKIIAENERTMNNKNRLTKMENKLITSGILDDWYDLKKSCKKLGIRLAPYGNWDEEIRGPLMKDGNGKYFIDNGTVSICMSSGSHWSDHFGFSYYDRELKWHIWHSTDSVLFTEFPNEDAEIEAKIKLIQLFLSHYEEYRSVQLDRINKKMSKISKETKEIKDELAAMSDL